MIKQIEQSIEEVVINVGEVILTDKEMDKIMRRFERDTELLMMVRGKG